jgi:putative peptide zinc metalloprotease protein
MFILPDADDLPGRFLTRGVLVGYIVDSTELAVRVVVDQQRVDLVRTQTYGIQMRLANDRLTIIEGEISRELPRATDLLPSGPLASAAGGSVVTNPQGQLRSLTSQFLFDIKPRTSAPIEFLGQPVEVRFDHGSAPMIEQSYRFLRQQLLSLFNV